MWHKDEVTKLSEQTFFGKPVVIEHLHGNLHANLHVPPNFNRSSEHGYPTALMLHGLGGNRHEYGGLFIKAAASLARAGIVTMRFDFRGAGETGGSSRDITINSQIQDANDALDHLLEYPFTDKKRVALIGFSFGGLTAACLAGKRCEVAALVLWQAAYDMKSIIKRVYGPMALRAVRTRGYMQAGLMQLDSAFFEALDHLDVDEHVSAFARPVLIIQGVADTVVPVDTAYQWKRSFASTAAEVDLIQDADHAFSNDAWAWNAIDRTSAWLEKTL